MPKTGTRETLILIGTAIGVAVSGSASADTRDMRGNTIILAQANQQQEQEEEQQRRRGRGERGQQEPQQEQRQERQERRERAQEERPQREDRRERVQQRQEEQRQERPGREERRERAQQKQEEQKRERPGREERRERAQQKQEEQKQERPSREERRERAQQEREQRQKERRERVEQRQERKQEQRQDRREEKRERVEQRQERKQEQRQDRREEKRERVEERRDQRQDRREDRRERAEDRVNDREISREERQERRQQRMEFSRERLGDIKRERRERRLEGGRVVIEEPGNRRIIRDRRGRVIIEHDETERLRGGGRNFRVEDGPRGRKRTIITRPNGVEIITVEDRNGRLLRRVKQLPNGRRIVLFNNEYGRGGRFRDDDDDYGATFYIDLPSFTVGIPEREYYVYADDADEYEIEAVLTAPPVEDLEQDYTLNEIRYSPDIRKRLRKLNFNAINFESGSWEIAEGEINKLDVVARVINRIIEKNPDEVFLIGGHTDAVGPDEDNLSLSDRRAETVARVLTDEFSVPPENLVTQGYGESDLLIETEQSEARNRRVEFMRITPFLAQKEQ